MSYTSVMVS